MVHSSSEKKREQAVALQYADAEKLPRVLATGSGELARQILEIAKHHEIPIEENEELAGLLGTLEAGAEIPQESYQLVAEVIAFLYYCDEEWRKEHGFLDDLLLPE